MEQHNALIEQLKREVQRKAIESYVPFDPEDIECHEVNGHYVIALTKIKWERTVLEDDVLVSYIDKVPALWLEYPPLGSMKQEELAPGKWEISIPIPRVRIRCPWLVYLIFPDGTYKTDDGAFDWLTNQCALEHTNEYLQMIQAGLSGNP